jgi:hypothetical protein
MRDREFLESEGGKPTDGQTDDFFFFDQYTPKKTPAKSGDIVHKGVVKEGDDKVVDLRTRTKEAAFFKPGARVLTPRREEHGTEPPSFREKLEHGVGKRVVHTPIQQQQSEKPNSPHKTIGEEWLQKVVGSSGAGMPVTSYEDGPSYVVVSSPSRETAPTDVSFSSVSSHHGSGVASPQLSDSMTTTMSSTESAKKAPRSNAAKPKEPKGSASKKLKETPIGGGGDMVPASPQFVECPGSFFHHSPMAMKKDVLHHEHLPLKNPRESAYGTPPVTEVMKKLKSDTPSLSNTPDYIYGPSMK